MKIAGLTMVYKDYWALSHWYQHHARAIGPENLFIISHGEDPKIAELCPEATIEVWPRDTLENFDLRRGTMLNDVQAELLRRYDWVFRTDADELLIWDPSKYNSLAGVFKAQDQVPVISALGFEIIGLPDDPAQGRLFEKHKNVFFSGHYSKAVAEQEAVPFHRHGVQVPAAQVATFPHIIPAGFYLAHLKHANAAALAEGDKHRQAAAQDPQNGLGSGWLNAQQESFDMLAEFQSKPMMQWHKARDKALAQFLKDPKRSIEDGLVRTKSYRVWYRTILPKWFERV